MIRLDLLHHRRYFLDTRKGLISRRKMQKTIFILKETKYFNPGLALKCQRKLYSDIRQNNASGRLFCCRETESCIGNGLPFISTGAPVCTLYLYTQCCGSGSGTFLTPVSGMEKIRIRDEHLKEFFRKFRNSFLVLKY